MPNGGRGIRSNALILQLDGDDPDAEGNELDRLARDGQPAIDNALQRQLQAVTANLDPDRLDNVERLVPTDDDDLREALERLLRESAGRGVRVTLEKLSQIAVGVNWQLANEAARTWAQQYSYELVSRLSDSSRRMLQAAVSDWINSGAPLDDLIARISAVFGPVRGEMIAVTEATRAYAEGSFTLYEQAGFNRRPVEADRPPAHVRCILPGTMVLPMGPVSAATKSFYVGGCVEIILGNGGKISVTENHPILTPNGWVQAKRLRQGDNVIYTASAERIASLVDPDNDYVPTRIEEIFGALVESGAVLASRVPATAEQFHGDGRRLYGYVDIVYVNGFLRSGSQPGAFQPVKQHNIEGGSMRKSLLFPDSLASLNVVGQGCPAGGGVGGDKHGVPFGFGSVRPASFHALGSTAGSDASFDQAITESPSVNTGLGSEFLLRFASLITTEEIVEIRNFFHVGHVYDLQCDTYELYTGNGFLVKNCRCWVSLAETDPGQWDYVWLTAQDELVCPICAPKHQTSIGFAGRR